MKHCRPEPCIQRYLYVQIIIIFMCHAKFTIKTHPELAAYGERWRVGGGRGTGVPQVTNSDSDTIQYRE